MKIFAIIVLGFMITAPVLALTGNEILNKVDDNVTADNKIVTSKMIIHGKRNDRTVESRSWMRGITETFTEYLSPAREKGTKMLKLEDELWTYSPQTDRTIRIAGHMLRQSVMGSDLSYEDFMEDPKLLNLYNASIDSETVYIDRDCWVLKLEAKNQDVTYHTRRIWVDKERFIVLKENRYAKSGKLLKTTDVKSVKRLDNRWVPVHIIFRDVLQKGKGTEFIIETINFDQDIPAHVFSKASLKR